MRARPTISSSKRQMANQGLSHADEISRTTIKEGAFNVFGVFLGVLPPRKNAADTAAAGQSGGGGGGGGGGSGKPPPVNIQVFLLGIDTLAEKQLVGADYTIVDSTTISVIARDNQAIKATQKSIDDSTKAWRAAKNKTPEDPAETERCLQNLAAAETSNKAAK
jgi:hypothetical protein